MLTLVCYTIYNTGHNSDAYTMSNTADVYFAQLKQDSKVRFLLLHFSHNMFAINLNAHLKTPLLSFFSLPLSADTADLILSDWY